MIRVHGDPNQIGQIKNYPGKWGHPIDVSSDEYFNDFFYKNFNNFIYVSDELLNIVKNDFKTTEQININKQIKNAEDQLAEAEQQTIKAGEQLVEAREQTRKATTSVRLAIVAVIISALSIIISISLGIKNDNPNLGKTEYEIRNSNDSIIGTLKPNNE